MVWAGSYTQDTPITVSTDTFAANKLVLTATPNEKTRVAPGAMLATTSEENGFTFYSQLNQIYFRVGADVNLSKGIYYLDWSITETQYSSTNTESNKYHHPIRTKVEVGVQNQKFQF